MSHLNWPRSPLVLVAQWIERPPGVLEVIGSIPVWDTDFFLCPMLVSLLIISSLSHFIAELKIHHHLFHSSRKKHVYVRCDVICQYV